MWVELEGVKVLVVRITYVGEVMMVMMMMMMMMMMMVMIELLLGVTYVGEVRVTTS